MPWIKETVKKNGRCGRWKKIVKRSEAMQTPKKEKTVKKTDAKEEKTVKKTDAKKRENCQKNRCKKKRKV